MNKKVAIVGAGDSRKLAPFDDLSWEIWSCNNLYPEIPRRDRWFEVHHFYFDGEKYYRKGEEEFRGKNVKDYLEDLNKLNCSVYMQKPIEIIKSSIPYPIKTILTMFRNYFTSTPAYMFALAILEDFDEIALYGINMIMDDEYQRQKPCLEYLIGIAEGKGKKIILPEYSGLLFSPHLYGYDFHSIEIIRGKIMKEIFQVPSTH